MKKLYYVKETGFVAERYPHNYPKDEDVYIEVDDDTFENTFSVENGHIWKVENGEAKIVLDTDKEISKQYNKMCLNNQMCDYKEYLSDTDYVISKLNELKLEDEDEYETEKVNYADVLAKRKEARKKINELTKEIESL